MKRDCISLSSFSREEIETIFSLTERWRDNGHGRVKPLRNKTAALIFEKQSLRTHVSFEVGIAQLGGRSVFLTQQQIGLQTRESVRDIAEVLSCYNDLIIARTVKHRTVEELASYASVPVINALTDLLHPCQILADVFTLRARGLLSRETKITFVGDGNNIVNSWLEIAGKLPLRFILACPKGYEPDAMILAQAQAAGISQIEITHDCYEAAAHADVLYTDVWVSMGQEAEREQRLHAFRRYQINDEMLRMANPECVIMHCLPAHRGEEITASVLEGSHSIVMEQAENRLHVQKGIMTYLVGGETSNYPSEHHRKEVSFIA